MNYFQFCEDMFGLGSITYCFVDICDIFQTLYKRGFCKHYFCQNLILIDPKTSGTPCPVLLSFLYIAGFFTMY